MKIAITDDWQNLARSSADWAPLERRAELTFRQDPFADEDEAAAFLADFDIILAMRERTPFPPSLVARLPKLKMFSMGGHRGKKIDIAGMTARGVRVCATKDGPSGASTAEIALGLLLAAARRIPEGDANIRAGGFQQSVPGGIVLAGKTLGLVGLGRIGTLMARYGVALGMDVIAWSPNMTEDRAAEAGARLVTKEALFSDSDAISLHIVYSERTHHLVDRALIARMRPGAILVNTARSALVDTAAMLEALREERIVVGLDVFDTEPLPPGAELPTLPNTVLTPHLGYSVREATAAFYGDMIENALAFLDGAPIRVIDAA